MSPADARAVEARPRPRIANGTYTIVAPAPPAGSGEHRTFRIRTARRGALARKRLLGLLVGPDNANDFEEFAFVYDDGIRVWERCRAAGSQAAVNLTIWERYARMVWDLLAIGETGRLERQGYRVLSSKACLRCNRKLTTPESIASNYGPECAGRNA